MTARCIGEPVSWLRLERLRLGELPEAERAAVAGHLAACAACAACLAHIETDQAELPPLEVREPRAIESARRPLSRVRRLFAGAGALAAAAVAVLAIGHAWRAPGPSAAESETGRTRSKGDGMAFVLVRADGERVVEGQGVFRDGDRFKALVTCPPSLNASFDLVVFDEGGDPSGGGSATAYPLEPVRHFSCGNEVPLPGAFRLTGIENETVCVVWRDEGAVDRAGLSRARELGDPRAMCKELRPATEPH
jgi:hypothetical protein